MADFLLGLDTQPMEAKLTEALPHGAAWQFEPKWDGFRCLAFKSGGRVELRAKSGKPLGRYFPEMVAALAGAKPDDFVLDGELMVPRGDTLSFSALQDRVHPAESRVRKLAVETPSVLVAFDCLAAASTGPLLHTPLADRRAALARVMAGFGREDRVRLSPFTLDRAEAARWLAGAHGALDGVVAKRLDTPYAPGKREMLKVKTHRSADCVVGGFRYGKDSRLVGSLLLGLYNAAGRAGPRRLHLRHQPRRAPGPDATARGAGGRPGLHRRGTGRSEPLGQRALHHVAAAAAGAGGRGELRPSDRRGLPPRHDAVALAPGQGAGAVHADQIAQPAAPGTLVEAIR